MVLLVLDHCAIANSGEIGQASPDFHTYVEYRLGWGPKVKIGQINKILWVQLGRYIRKPGEKSLTQKKLILMRGIAFEKNGPCSWENEVKNRVVLAVWGVPEMALQVPESKL